MQKEESRAGIPPQRLKLWLDPLSRDGYSNMAADELLSRREEAWLRVYAWVRPAVSFGYFDTAAVAEGLFPPLDGQAVEYIRRWTGGGIVDHRSGVTYTLTLPAVEGGMYPASDGLYRWIHAALTQALQEHGVQCQLLVEDAPDGGRSCWASPVASDIVDPAGEKLAGAGQRRYRGAVLHQGLVQGCSPSAGWERRLAQLLCPELEVIETAEPYAGFTQELEELLASKYLTPAWEDESHGRRSSSHH